MSETSATCAILFDLDGTLVDTALNFAAIRQEMGIPPGEPILELLAKLPPAEADRCREILHHYEWEGARRAKPMPGVAEFLERLDRCGVRRGVITRNGRDIALAALERAGLQFDLIVAREDAPVKPHPAPLQQACQVWQVECHQAAMIGDYWFDIEAGRRAGMRTVLYTQGREADGLPGAEQADFHLRCFTAADPLLEWLQITER